MEKEKEFSFNNIFGKRTEEVVQLGYNGPITIEVVTANLKKDNDTFGKMDPYCVINVAG